jgi:hypothetical protein
MTPELRNECLEKIPSKLRPIWIEFENIIDHFCEELTQLLKKYRNGNQGPEMTFNITNRRDQKLLRFIPQKKAIKARIVNMDNAITDMSQIFEPDKIDTSKKIPRFEYFIQDEKHQMKC